MRPTRDRSEADARRAADADGKSLLEVSGLRVGFRSGGSEVIDAVRGVDLVVARGTCLAIVGETGSGKSLTLRAVMGLLGNTSAQVTGGSVVFDGTDLLGLKDEALRRVRGQDISLVSQDVLSSLHPMMTVGTQIDEAILVHNRGLGRRAARERTVEYMDRVGIASASRRADDYPLSFSGGMRQRAAIAMALVNTPRLLLADEPTTAVDVTIQAQILDLLRRIQQESGMSMIVVTHDLGVVRELAHEVNVMYAGRIVESGAVREVFERPGHPYTRGLMRARPSGRGRSDLVAIPGEPPAPGSIAKGCSFAARCPLALPICQQEDPPVVALGPGRTSECHRALEVVSGAD